MGGPPSEGARGWHVIIWVRGLQVVGLGKPVLTFPGEGPQFTPRFCELQGHLLGRSLIVCEGPHRVAEALVQVLQDGGELAAIAQNGRRRLGSPGAAKRIARSINALLLTEVREVLWYMDVPWCKLGSTKCRGAWTCIGAIIDL
ncbi:hypothetical protein CYMTET_20156 [Cymbomonas tetramitiformis]|uniref:Uncharacterized protein n=1 Tax=Cymbomonas tetramitiformis TaxID=36881 RepID=A0AAE0L4G2_9CHLO|nr:hypothetical protein CYMTET_20156 [Cymbomonas tetramitiformis]